MGQTLATVCRSPIAAAQRVVGSLAAVIRGCQALRHLMRGPGPHAADTAQRQASRAGDERFRIVSDTTAAALLDAADRARYRAKARGKDQWVLRALDTGANENPSPMVKCNSVIPESGTR